MKKCNEVMTKNPVCCLQNDTALKAAELMKSENVGSIPHHAIRQGQADVCPGRAVLLRVAETAP